jgi:hypothetical protein
MGRPKGRLKTPIQRVDGSIRQIMSVHFSHAGRCIATLIRKRDPECSKKTPVFRPANGTRVKDSVKLPLRQRGKFG